MPRQSQLARLVPERDPITPDEFDAEANRVFVTTADAIEPNSRQALGEHSPRVAKAAIGETFARPSDFIRTVLAGGDPAPILAFLDSLKSAVKRANPVQRPTHVVLLRETTEANVAVVDYRSDPTPEKRRKAVREVTEAELLLELERDALHAEPFVKAEERFLSLSRCRS